MVLLVLLELGNNVGSVLVPRSDDAGTMKWLNQMRGNPDIADFLKKQPGFVRANVNEEAIPENWGALHGVEMWGGYLAGVTTNLLRFEFYKYQSRMLYGVGYTISPKPVTDGGREVFAAVSGMKVYRYPEAFPRAWAVHELVQAQNPEVGNRMIMEQLPDFHHLAFLSDPAPALETCDAPDEVAVREHTPNQVRIQAKMACKGMVVLSDTFFPGWRATIDGASAPIYEVNAAMRGVIVPAGPHTLTFHYRPAAVVWGALLTLLGVGGAIALAILGNRVAVKEPEDAYASRM
jgi:hypothetical protein